MLHDRVASLELQLSADEQKLKSRESELLGWCSVAYERVQAASTFAKALIKRQSALSQKVASLRDQLSAAVWTNSVDFHSKFASLREKLTAANAMVGKMRAQLQSEHKQLEHNHRRTKVVPCVR